MTAQSQLVKLLSTTLPCRSQQRRKPYRPDRREIHRIYGLLNRAVFDGRLHRPTIITQRETDALGWCVGILAPRSTRSGCLLRLSDKWFSVHWLIFVMAHEMSHQYQWDIIGPQRQAQGKPAVINHGRSFFIHKKRLAELGIPLMKQVRIHRWFTHQDLKKL